MTIESFPFNNRVVYEPGWRDMAENWRTSGILVQGNDMDATGGDCAVEPGTGLEIQISPGRAWIKGHLFKHTDDPEYLPVSPNNSGSTRNDLVVLRLLVSDIDNADRIQYQILEGTTTPVRNDTYWDLPLATVAVADGASSISSSDITDQRVPSVHGFVPAARIWNNSLQSIPSATETTVAFNTAIYDNCNAWNGSTRLTAPMTGLYLLTICISWASSGTGTRRIRIRKNGTTNLLVEQWQPGIATQEWSGSTVARLIKGDYIEGRVYQSSGGSLNIGSQNESDPILTMTYLGG